MQATIEHGPLGIFICSFAAVFPQSCIRDVRRNANRRPGVFMYDADGLWKSSPKLILLAAPCLQFENRVGDWIPLTAAANGYRLFSVVLPPAGHI